jgi:outer membrane putative beta-barrel porin/alpha-amylase
MSRRNRQPTHPRWSVIRDALHLVHRSSSVLMTRVVRCLILALLVAPLTTATLNAQDLEPKAYSASPVGAEFLVAGLSRSTGSVLVDPTLPITDVDARINGVVAAAGYTFSLFDRVALVTGGMPYLWGDVSGVVGEDAASVSRSGIGDARLKFSINLHGNPAMGARAFAKAPRQAIVGTSVTVVAPSGQYDAAKLINLGTNRWSFKPEVGVSVPKGPWDLDAYLGVWLFTRNSNFFPGGVTRTQDAVVALQAHGSYTLRPRLWAAIDATWYAGGATQVEGGRSATPMNNSRLGATVSFPMTRFQSLKFAYSSGLLVRTGTNFQTFSIGYQWLRFTKL